LLPTAFAEVAYYRLLFLEGTSANLGMVQTGLTAFRITVETERGIDLTASPFAAFAAIISSPVDYRETQELGSAMRASGVEVFRYASARDPQSGLNVGVFIATAFGKRQPRQLEHWHCTASRERVELTRRDYFERGSHAFDRSAFLVAGKLPAPAP
jgi:hypothetical protein